MRQSMYAEPIPDEAERYKSLKIQRDANNGRYLVKAWRGKQSRPFANYYFRDEASREQWVAKQKEAEDARETFKAKQKEAGKADIATMVKSLQVGTILHYSWGYEQTQCEYFEIVEKRGHAVTIREIAAETIPGSDYQHGMADMRRPMPGRFINGPIQKRVGRFGIRMKHGCATPTAPDTAHYCSWYA